MSGRQQLEVGRKQRRKQEWVESWVSWISMTTRLIRSTQQAKSRDDVVRDWLEENDYAFKDTVLENEVEKQPSKC